MDTDKGSKDKASKDVTLCDIMIIYGEEDQKEAETLRDHLRHDLLSDVEVAVALYDDADLGTLENAFETCSFAVVYLTKTFCESHWKSFTDHDCVIKALYSDSRKCSVIPFYTADKSVIDYRIPMGLNALRGIKYFHQDEFYRKSARKVFLENRLPKKLE